MEHIYPAFERGRIMKKELLWALRDYSYSALQLRYLDYPDGIISGCDIRTEKDYLYIGPGVIKCQGFVFLLTKEEAVKYAPTEQYVSLKFRLLKKEELPDYVRYVTEFALDNNLERMPGEIEICRYKLKEGARLRTDYKDFYDIQTEFDTVNLVDSTWSAQGGNTLSKKVTDYFARKVLECKDADAMDIQFAYFLLQSSEATVYDILENYVIRKKEFEIDGWVEAEKIFGYLAEILEMIRRSNSGHRMGKSNLENRMIILD